MKRDDGQELNVHFPDLVPIRDGHQVTVAYGSCADGSGASPIAIFNESLGKTYMVQYHVALRRLEIKYKNPHPFSLWSMGAIAVSIFSLVLFHWGWWMLGISIVAFWFTAYLADPIYVTHAIKNKQGSFHSALQAIADEYLSSKRDNKVAVT